MYKIYLFILLILSSSLVAKTVTVAPAYNEDEAIVSAGELAVYNSMITEKTSGQEPNQSTYPIKVYIALEGDNNENNRVIFAPPKDDSIPDMNDATNSYIHVPLQMKKDTTDSHYLHFAAYNSVTTKWTVVDDSLFSITTSTATVPHTYSIQLSKLVEKAGITLVASDSKTYEVDGYFFLDDEALNDGDDIIPSEYETGAYYEFKLSNELPDNNLSFIELKKGDTRLKAIFTGGDDITRMNSGLAHNIIAARWNDLSPSHLGDNFQDIYPGGEILEEVDPVDEGYIDIKNLNNITSVNDVSAANTYNVSLFMMNKYQFLSVSSAAKFERPEPFEVLLEKQACFIVTSGFGEEHYVLDYFRDFRDTTLIKTTLGKKFINFYYKYSPEYARKIYHNENMRLIVRTVSYMIYYIMNYFYLLILLALGLFLAKKSRKFRMSA